MLLSAYEGFGLTVLEAQSASVPVVVSDLEVLREVGGEGACYVEPSDTAGVAAVLSRLLSDAEFRRHMREEGLRNVLRFPWRTTAIRTLDAYRSVSHQP